MDLRKWKYNKETEMIGIVGGEEPDDVFYPDTYKDIVKIHNKLVKQIKEMIKGVVK